MTILDRIFGKYLTDSDSEGQRIGVLNGIPMLGLDALSSSAYGTEAALTVLLPLGALSLHYIIPISSIIIGLLFIVFISYRQTIRAYPTGGGSYTVAKENLGRLSGLLAAAALMLDYVLTVAVGIAAGVGALISAIPVLQPHTLALCLVMLAFITIVNLRGVKDSGSAFLIPTYLFIASLLGVLALGVFKSINSGGHPTPLEPLHVLSSTPAQSAVTIWILLRAFASGCAAMTGVEAVSNGVKAFREPVVDNARRTLTIIILVLIAMLAGVAYLCSAYGISATDPTGPGYESVVSQIIRAVVGKGVVYYITVGSIISVLAISANTAFADFPRLCQIVANDNYLPYAFAERGRRLVFSHGILVLATLSAILLLIFGGVTDKLIPLYAIGAFLAFTLSQAGMVVHWKRKGTLKNLGKFSINALGATATGITMLVVLVSKFTEGGWISFTIVILLLCFFYGVHRHYIAIRKEIKTTEPISLRHREEPIVIVPFRDWSKLTRKALEFAMQLSTDVYAVHAIRDEQPTPNLEREWQEYVLEPIKKTNIKPPELIQLPSPYRRLFGSLISFLDETEKKFPERHIAVVVPNLSECRWYHYFLHNHRAVLLSAVLFMRRDPRIILVTVPWYLKS
jgi:amino acid transporter